MQGLQRTRASALYTRLSVLPRFFLLDRRSLLEIRQIETILYSPFGTTPTKTLTHGPFIFENLLSCRTKTLVTSLVGNSVENSLQRRAGVHLPRSLSRCVPPVAAELQSQRTQKAGDV